MWIHVYFLMIRATGNVPETLTNVSFLNPSPYLGLALKPEKEMPNLQPLTCASQ
jgi:hypothetical protein